VIYSWYRLYFTPFLVSVTVVPLAAWSITVIPTYLVWRFAHDHGAPWVVPAVVWQWEYTIPVVAGALVLGRAHIARIINSRRSPPSSVATEHSRT